MVLPKQQQYWSSHSLQRVSSNADTCAVGIDLGTTNSCVSAWIPKKGRAKTLRQIDNGRKSGKTMPSSVFLGTDGRILSVGDEAVKNLAGTPGGIVHSVKRLIGRSIAELNTANFLQDKSYEVVERPNALPEEASIGVRIPGGNSGSVSPEEICAAIITSLKNRAEQHLKRTVTDVVITVPAFFNERQRSATKSAGEIAGLNVLQVITEPMAAAISYGLTVAGRKTIIVIDLGGGTFDVSVISVDDGKVETISIGGKNNLGGNDIDSKLMKYALEKISKKLEDLDADLVCSLRLSCEKAKIQLSSEDACSIDWCGNSVTISREELQTICSPFLESCKKIILGVLADAKKKAADIDEILLVGLPTKMICFQTMVESIFPHQELCKSISPDLAVSQGAAIQAAIKTGASEYKLKKILMLDALPYSLGLEGSDGRFEVVLPRNTKTPVKSTRRFFTSRDFQPALTIDMFEGEDDVARNNHWIGYHNLIIPRGKHYLAGERSMNVVFEITSEGILIVKGEVPDEELTCCEMDDSEDSARMFRMSILLVTLIILYITLKMSTSNERDL